ncbi:hypothetical protein A6A04_10890 [Paramagnetospirillum marisnigri]|uniref:Uncharacterized protein n=1 Tax=Paramagnetospirillum marisnigri TaxID=1285242 RepID=A0A178MX03_9PROT|nr:hypothetical protein A6A04_10890 [Paramagnetospirillum marisnigri]
MPPQQPLSSAALTSLHDHHGHEGADAWETATYPACSLCVEAIANLQDMGQRICRISVTIAIIFSGLGEASLRFMGHPTVELAFRPRMTELGRMQKGGYWKPHG